jgi:hypothetical protein
MGTSFSSVPMQSELQKSGGYFYKEEKAVPLM